MKKTWLYIGVGLLVIIVGGGIALRLAAKSFVESEEFRTEFTQILERAVGSISPHAMAQVREIRLVGLASLEFRGIELHNSKQLDAPLRLPRLKATPALLSLLGSAPIQVKAEGDLDNKGRITFVALVPKSLLEAEKPGHKVDQLDVTGKIERLDVVGVSSLLFVGAAANPNFRLTRGFLSGTFSFQKPFGGHASAGRKTGNINAKLENAEWTLAVGPVKKLQPPTIDLHLEIQDFALKLQTPVVFSDKIGRAQIGGSLLFPERADRTLAWDLDVKTEGLLLQGSLTKLFKCKQPPTKPHFTVTGPIAQTICLAAK